MQCVGSEFKEAAEFPRRCGGPEGEFLHQRGVFGGDEGFELGVEGGKVGMGGDRVEGGVVTLVALVFPDVDYDMLLDHPLLGQEM